MEKTAHITPTPLDTPRDPKAPLIVDMDGTLLCSDTLVEGIASGLFQRPLSMIGRLVLAPLSRPKLKSWVFENIDVDYEAIPENAELVEYLKQEKKSGRAIHLVSAADQGVVEKVAERYGFFDSAVGSANGVNLKGTKKLALIQERYGNDFVYAGDSRPDWRVWSGASGAIYAGTSASVPGRLEKVGPGLEADFSRQGSGLRVWMKALRMHQWSKNVLLFIPLILAHAYRDLGNVATVLLAFLCMGIVASGTYLINDLSDLSADRRHRTKKNRPLASTKLPIGDGMLAAIALVGGGLAAAFWLNMMFGVVLCAYLITTLSYSIYFKRRPIMDMFVLASLYTLRLLMGTVVIGLPYSQWLITFSMFFFFSLSLAKRHTEIADASAKPGVLVKGRGYFPEDAPLTLGFGLASGTASILILVLFVVDEAYDAGIYRTPELLSLIPLIIGMWTARIWLLAHRGWLDDDPVSFAVRDWKSIVMGFVLAGILAAAILI